MSAEEQRELKEVIEQVMSRKSRSESLLRWVPAVIFLVTAIAQQAIYSEKLREHIARDGHPEVSKKMHSVERRSDVIEESLRHMRMHTVRADVHQTETEKKALMLNALNPINIKIAEVQVGQSNLSKDMEELKEMMKRLESK